MAIPRAEPATLRAAGTILCKPATDGGSGISDQDHAESESHEPQQTPPKKPGDKKGGGGMNPVPPNRRTALKPAQEVKPNEPS